MANSPGKFNWEIKRGRYDSGNTGEDTLRFPITCRLDFAKVYELYFQHYNKGIIKECEDIEFTLFPLTPNLAT